MGFCLFFDDTSVPRFPGRRQYLIYSNARYIGDYAGSADVISLDIIAWEAALPI